MTYCDSTMYVSFWGFLQPFASCQQYFLVNIVSVSDWRGPFSPLYCIVLRAMYFHKCATRSDVQGKITECMMTLLVYMNVCEKLLTVSGCDVELNPGPSKTCPKCKKSVPNRTIVCVLVGILLVNENKMIQR